MRASHIVRPPRAAGRAGTDVAPVLRVRSVAGLVLERDPEPDPELLDLSVLDRHVLADDLRDAQVTDGLRGGRDGSAGGIRPGLGAGPDDLGDPVDAAGHVRLPFLGWVEGPTLSLSPRRRHTAGSPQPRQSSAGAQ